MEHNEKPDLDEKPASPRPEEKRSYSAPKVESVRLSKEAAESLT